MVSRRASFAIVLCLAGAALSGLLLLEHHGERPAQAAVEAICGEGGQGGCEAVSRSAYARVAGVPLAALGLFFYLSLGGFLVLGWLAGAETLAATVATAIYALLLALAVDAALLGIQAFALKAYCMLCIATYAVNFAGVLVLLPAVRETRGQRGSLLRGEGRLVLAGWALCGSAVAAAILASDATLAYREEQRSARILGDPAAVSPGTAPSGALQRAQEEARRLKEILDDPQKREQYLTEKSVKEFEDAAPLALSLAGTPVEGPPGAPIQVVEFSDFLCPFCRGVATAFNDYVPKSGGRVAIHFKHYPLDKACNPLLQNTVHEGACWLALGGICAHDQGRFWPYHDKVFGATLAKATREDAGRLAGEAGLDARALDACLGSARTKERLAADIAEAERSGVKATPTLFLNGKRLPRVSDFLLAVDKEAARLKLSPLPNPAAP